MSDTLILDDRAVRELMTMPECMNVMVEALAALEAGNAVNPLRSGLRFPGKDGLLGVMPGYLGEPECAGIKVITITPGNHGTPFDSHQGVILLFELEHGRLRAVIDASSVTAIRTAAVSGVATRVLARPDARVLALIGSGVQAQAHLEAMASVRNLSEVRVWSRHPDRVRAFVSRHADGVPIRATDSAADATEGADIICTTTSARAPVLHGDAIPEGVHINAVGACLAPHRELDTTVVVRARVFVDRMESALNEAGDLLIPLKEGAIQESHILGELGAVLAGAIEGRRSREEVTLFKSLGLAVEDLAAAHFLLRRAKETGAGRTVDLGGLRETR